MAEEDDCKKLILSYNRRLQLLKQKQAVLGINTPADILMEIEDIEAKIEELKEELNKINLGKQQIIINIDKQQVTIHLEDVQKQAQKFLSEPVVKSIPDKNQVKQLAQEFRLLETTKANPHLKFLDGDISYWYEQGLSVDELKLQFVARRIMLDACDKGSVIISDQGVLSWAAQQVMAYLLKAKAELSNTS